MSAIVFITAAAHLFYTPFTKVEESFNLQAMHDILYLRHNFTQYDHFEFPGVVPRTFLGPLFISIISSPFILLFESMQIHKFWAQYVVRLVLAGVITASWSNLRNVITKLMGIQVTLWFTLITISQFHFIFYMSRPLPNIMALPLVLHAISSWLKGRIKTFIIFAGLAIIIFRAEVAIFLSQLLAYDVYRKKIHTIRLLKIIVPVGALILIATVAVDSFFWRRLVWPEGEVLWYNTILNKSSNWGTSPFLWYFYSALPRAMGISLAFVPFGIYTESRIRPLVISAATFVFLYSFLPHKELRFIIYVFPIFNLAAACACNRLWLNSAKSLWQGFLAIFAGAHILVNVLLTLFLLVVSSTNYPGGVAMSRLHRLEQDRANVTVHISNLAAQSGVSRFMEIRSDWIYSKNESLSYSDISLLDYSHLLVEAKNKFTQDWNILQEHFEAIEFVDCFSNIGIQYNSVFPVRVKTKPCIGIMKRRMEKAKAKFFHIDADSEINITTIPNLSHKLDIEFKGKPKLFNQIKDTIVSDQNEDGVVIFNVESSTENLSIEASTSPKEINFQELRNLALGKINKKTKATKAKLREIIEQHYRSKGSIIENDSKEQPVDTDKLSNVEKKPSIGVRQTVKSIIRQEKIKEMIEKISKMDLTKICDLNKLTTKDCLKQVIDDIDEASGKTNL